MKLNNKGFTLVEIIAVVAIMAILMGVAVVGVSKYQESAREDAYETMEASAHAAAQNYIQKYNLIIQSAGQTPAWTEISISDLVGGEFLKPLKDPKARDHECIGTVYAQKEKASGNKLSHITYKVKVICEQYTSERVECFNSTPSIDNARKCTASSAVQAKCNEIAKKQKVTGCPSGYQMYKLEGKIFE